MPDMERLTRSLELHLAPTPEAKAFVLGKHSGLDEARKQVVWIAATLALFFIAGVVYLR